MRTPLTPTKYASVVEIGDGLPLWIMSFMVIVIADLHLTARKRAKAHAPPAP